MSLGSPPGRGVVDRGAERRVVLIGIVGAAMFVTVAAIVAVTGLGGGSIWLPLHLALAGGAGLAIAALVPHFTVSLSGSRPAPAPIRLAGLAFTAVGAVTVAIAFPSNVGSLALVGASAYLVGIAVSAATAFIPARAGLGRRFGIVEAAYGLGLVNAMLAVGLAMLRLGDVATISGAWLGLKPAHAWLNLLGFLSLIIAGTLVHLYPTVVGSRIRSRPALLGLVAGVGLGAPTTALGYALDAAWLARLGAVAVVAGAAALVVVTVGAWPGRGRWTTDLDWHRLTIGHLSAAVAWFVIGVAAMASGVAIQGSDPSGWSLSRVIGPIVIGWALQALVGAWSHLLPSVGPGDTARHAAQRRALGRWPVARLVAWNAGAAVLSAGALWPGELSLALAAGSALVGLTLLASLTLLLRAITVRVAAGD